MHTGIDLLIVFVLTAFGTACLTLFLAAVGTRNRENEAYMEGFNAGCKEECKKRPRCYLDGGCIYQNNNLPAVAFHGFTVDTINEIDELYRQKCEEVARLERRLEEQEDKHAEQDSIDN